MIEQRLEKFLPISVNRIGSEINFHCKKYLKTTMHIVLYLHCVGGQEAMKKKEEGKGGEEYRSERCIERARLEEREERGRKEP